MKKLLYIPVILLYVVGSFSGALGQKNTVGRGDSELEEWRKKAKMFAKKPDMLKAEIENYQNQINDLKRRNKQLETGSMPLPTGSKPGNDTSMISALARQERELDALKQDYEKLKTAMSIQKQASSKGIQTGLIYRIQIGAFVLEKNNSYNNLDKETLSIESKDQTQDGMFKYVMGSFRSYDEALRFRDKLVEMGMKTAWVVPYIDGLRTDMNNVKAWEAKQKLNHSTYYVDEK